jgi:hypothetical protein
MRGSGATTRAAQANHRERRSGCVVQPREARMRKPNVTAEWLVAAFMLGVALFNYPLLSLFNTDATVFGVPLLYVFIFVAWGGLIGLTAWIIARER